MLPLHHIITDFIVSGFTLSLSEKEIPRLEHLFSGAHDSSESVSGSFSPNDIDALKP